MNTWTGDLFGYSTGSVISRYRAANPEATRISRSPRRSRLERPSPPDASAGAERLPEPGPLSRQERQVVVHVLNVVFHLASHRQHAAASHRTTRRLNRCRTTTMDVLSSKKPIAENDEGPVWKDSRVFRSTIERFLAGVAAREPVELVRWYSSNDARTLIGAPFVFGSKRESDNGRGGNSARSV
jgi:hypothetical protein